MPPKPKPVEPAANPGPDIGDASDESKEASIIPPGSKPLPPALPKPPRLQMESVPLVDIPCVFLNDRLCWPDFKRALTECGLIWNLSDWMTTIVYRGVEWKLIRDKGTDLRLFSCCRKNGGRRRKFFENFCFRCTVGRTPVKAYCCC